MRRTCEPVLFHRLKTRRTGMGVLNELGLAGKLDNTFLLNFTITSSPIQQTSLIKCMFDGISFLNSRCYGYCIRQI